jgi:hypothetical protein
MTTGYDTLNGKRIWYCIYPFDLDKKKHYGYWVNCRHCGKRKFIEDNEVDRLERDNYCSRTCRNYKASYNKKDGKRFSI